MKKLSDQCLLTMNILNNNSMANTEQITVKTESTFITISIFVFLCTTTFVQSCKVVAPTPTCAQLIKVFSPSSKLSSTISAVRMRYAFASGLENFSAAQVEISEWGRMDWINDLDTPEIIIWVQNLDESDQLLLTLLVVDNLRKTDAAKIMKKHDSAISRKLKKLRESLAKILSDGSIKQ